MRMFTRGERRARRGGFTIVELLVVIAIIGILAGLLLPVLVAARCRSKEGGNRQRISQMDTALKQYETDYGKLPPDKSTVDTAYSSFTTEDLVTAMESKGPRNTPYYEFRKNEKSSTGKWMSLLDNEYFYRENKSEKDSDLEEYHNRWFCDIWTKDCKGKDGVSPGETDGGTTNWK